jgi:rSAM/selenodomain-associated transferase 1
VAPDTQKPIGVGLLTKLPQPGFSKTRLARHTGDDVATRLAAAFLSDVAAIVAEVGRDPGVSPFVFYRPQGAERELASLLPPGLPMVLQTGEELGITMLAALRHMLAVCPGGAILIGSDLPTLPVRVLREAIAALRPGGERAVFGPSVDGGYYLVGMTSDQPAPLLAPLPWSTPDVMRLTRERAQKVKIDIVEVGTWFDVDDADDLARLRDELTFLPATVAPHTRRVLLDLP